LYALGGLGRAGTGPRDRHWREASFYLGVATVFVALEQFVGSQGLEQIARRALVDAQLAGELGDGHGLPMGLEQLEEPRGSIHGRNQARKHRLS